MGVFPIVSTANDAMQQPSAAEVIIACLLDRPVAITANSESQATATSSGFTDKAGKG